MELLSPLWFLLALEPWGVRAARDSLASASLMQSSKLVAHLRKQQRQALHDLQKQVDGMSLTKIEREESQAELDQLGRDLSVQEHVEAEQRVQEQAAREIQSSTEVADRSAEDNEATEETEDEDEPSNDEDVHTAARGTPTSKDLGRLLQMVQTKCSAPQDTDDQGVLSQIRGCLSARQALSERRTSILQKSQSFVDSYANHAAKTLQAIRKLQSEEKQRKAFERDSSTAAEVLLLKLRSIKNKLEGLKHPSWQSHHRKPAT
mmetsp:Transcript_98811/g.175984  ORF Transcript_98811/g.175984 Transcript_98811/m.175984 type:complete len:262 (+) Transcript_98811:100-885(+)|eukprot:CAMPEP_0197631582 /NCGR_PEP_ID=MMETSP1338-20131121/8705_1 /TAXON_ID=43686 ORGANISM="Pelagodinium beii, Strain RCC1491" /NCGR_SAMPLE_ID=MMETSP1338 /ASSEMBLY_ACC=CAM_ASM_000754 /LENGTH=261 /DNA_ID=CAMNT_0043203075 /DNA_START=97 /DNA_END=882 /DNA_ORIENTATION=-